MGKGSVLAIIIIIAIVAIGAYFVLSYLQLIPGEYRPPPLRYKNDIITIEDYFVSNTEPYAGGMFIIGFVLQNNGDKPAKNVEVEFSDPGFEKIELECPDFSTKVSVGVFGKKCIYDSIDSLDVRSITATFTTKKYIGGVPIPADVQLTTRFSVQYEYKGYRVVNIPIVDGITRKEPINKFLQSTPSYGPIVLEFKLGEGHEVVREGKTIKEYWGTYDRPFELKMSFRHVGSSSIGKINDTYIENGCVGDHCLKLDLKNTLIKVGGFRCDFEQEGDKLINKKSVKIPGELICSFTQAQKGPKVPEITGVVEAEFGYVYKFERYQDITVLKLPKE